MKKNVFMIMLILVLSFQLNAKKITNKVLVHPTAQNLAKEEVAILGVSKDVTLIEIDKSKFKANGDRVYIAPGKHTFQVKKPLSVVHDGELSRELEAGKYYVLDSRTKLVGIDYYITSYKIYEVSEEDFENYDRKVLKRLTQDEDESQTSGTGVIFY